MADYKNKLGGLADKLKREQPKTPIQEVQPVKQSHAVKAHEGQLNVWIPKALLRKMKRYGIDKELSLKDITIKAIEGYLSSN